MEILLESCWADVVKKEMGQVGIDNQLLKDAGFKQDVEGDNITIMDNGWTEHTGCPTHEGRKWIATMWYREGVTREKDWSYWSRFGREGV